MSLPNVQQNEELEIAIRDYTRLDQDVVLGTWIASLCRQRPYCEIDRFYFSAQQRCLVHALLKTGACRIACSPTDPDQVFGYMVYGKPRTLHWIYVRFPFRRAYVGTRLMSDAFGEIGKKPIEVSCMTSAMKHLQTKWNVNYRPVSVCEQIRGYFE